MEIPKVEDTFKQPSLCLVAPNPGSSSSSSSSIVVEISEILAKNISFHIQPTIAKNKEICNTKTSKFFLFKVIEELV